MLATTPTNLATYVVGQHVVQGRGSAVALVTPQGEVTFETLWRLSLQAAGALRANGLCRGDRVLLALPDGLDFAVFLFGTLAAGGVVVMANPEAPSASHRDLGQYVGSRVLIDGDAVAGWRSRAHNAEALAEAVEVAPHDCAFWLLTSGSTGAPKAAMHRHHDFIAHTELYAKGVLGMSHRDRTMAVSKLHFPYATGMNLLFPLALGGSAVLFPKRVPAAELLRLAALHKPTIFSTVPTMTARLLALPVDDQRAFSSLRLAVSAGEALPPDLLSKWRHIHTAPMLDGIGSAEMFHVYITNRPDDVRPACLGLAVPGYETRVVGEDGVQVAANDVGVLWVRGPSAALGYHNDAELTAKAFLNDGWVVTGDMFRKTADGYHFLEGRSDDLLKVAGLYVSPLEVEAVLRAHAAVKDCAVVGRMDEHGLIKPQACVVLAAGWAADEQLWMELADFARQRLLGYKVPKWWHALEDLPRNDRGKVVRKVLRDSFAAPTLHTNTPGRA